MTKLEFYNHICKQLPQGDEKNIIFNAYIKELYSLTEKAIKNNKEILAAQIADAIIDFSMRYGAISTIKNLSFDNDTNNVDNDLLLELNQEVEISLHNFQHRVNCPNNF